MAGGHISGGRTDQRLADEHAQLARPEVAVHRGDGRLHAKGIGVQGGGVEGLEVNGHAVDGSSGPRKRQMGRKSPDTRTHIHHPTAP